MRTTSEKLTDVPASENELVGRYWFTTVDPPLAKNRIVTPASTTRTIPSVPATLTARAASDR